MASNQRIFGSAFSFTWNMDLCTTFFVFHPPALYLKNMKKYIISFITLIALFYSGNFAFAQNLNDGDISNDVCINMQTQILRFRANDSSTNGEVSLLQDFLIDKGYLTGSPTGFYGRLTVNAVKSYQREVGVSPTGNVGPLTKSFIIKETCDGYQPLPVPVVITPGNGIKNFTFYKVSDDKRSCKVAMFVGNVGLVNGMYVYKSGEYATEAECKNALGVISQDNQPFQVWIPDLKGGNALSAGKSATATWTSSANSRADSYSVYLEKIKGNNDSRIYVGTAYEYTQYTQSFNFTIPATTAPGTYTLVFNGKGGSGGSSQMFQVVSVNTGGINILSATLDNISSTQINLNLHGSGFKKGANLYLNGCVSGSEASFSSNSDTQTGVGYDKTFFFNCAPANSHANVYLIGVDGRKSNVVSVYVSATFAPTPSPNDKSFSLLAPTDIERGNIVTTVNSGGYANVCWKSGAGNADQLMSFSIMSLNSPKGDGAYQLGSAYLSQKCFVFSVPKNLKTDEYLVIASNSDNTLYANSPSFRVVSNVPDPTIDSFSINDAQEFSLSARNYSSISFRADCGNGVATTLSPSRTSKSYPQGASSLCSEYQFYQMQGVDTGFYPSIYNQYLSLWLNNSVDGSITYVGSPQNMNISGEYTLKVRVCNLTNKCVEAQAPGKFYAKG